MTVWTLSQTLSNSAILSIANSARNSATATASTHHCCTKDGASIHPARPATPTRTTTPYTLIPDDQPAPIAVPTSTATV